jgi:lysophospholipase L1-like esterase
MATKRNTYLRSFCIVILLFALIILQACKPKESASKPFPDLKVWDLLIISDSSNWGVGQYYAKLIEADMNVKVNLHDCWVGSLSSLATLQTLQSGGTIYVSRDASCQRPWTGLVNEAEVMVLFGNSMGSDSPIGVDTCVAGGYSGQNQLPEFEKYKATLVASCTPENWTTYKTNLGMVIDEIIKIHEGRPLILRMTDMYIPVHSDFKANGVDEVCTSCLKNFSDAIRQVAAEHGVAVADTMVGFNGSDYMSDPVEAGYIGSDGIHISDKGAQYIASLLQQTGYEYVGR